MPTHDTLAKTGYLTHSDPSCTSMRERRNMNDLGGSITSTRPDNDELLRWHIDRYDRLRASTASRAAIVLSAAAILSAGNAVILSKLLPPPGSRGNGVTLALVALTVVGAVLIIASLIQASNVLLTRKQTRVVFDADGTLPLSLLFNGSDTVRQAKTFGDFQSILRDQQYDDIVTAAEVELWVCIQQHRKRYGQLRRCTRTLQFAGLAFLAVLLGFVLANTVPMLA